MKTKKSNIIFPLLSLSLFLVVSSLSAIAAEGPKPNDVVSSITVKNTTDYPLWISFVPSDPRRPQQKMDVEKTPITEQVYEDYGKPGSVFHFGFKGRQKSDNISYDRDAFQIFYDDTIKSYIQFNMKFEYNASKKELLTTISSKKL